MKVKALAPWFGSNRLLAENVGAALRDCNWVGVPFAGGMCELVHITARTKAVNDLHREVINLAEVVAHPTLGARLARMLRRTPYHPDTLAACQDFIRHADPPHSTHPKRSEWDVQHAHAYFVCAWLTRHGTAGTPGEFTGKLAVRWNAAGGDNVKHFRGAIECLRDWRKVLAGSTFTTLDAFDFLKKCKDEPGHGIYADPPFPGPGDAYTHTFGEEGHRRLAATLAGFQQARVVARFYDVPLVRELYPEPAWEWNLLTGRKQTNDAAPEVLLVRN